MKTFSKRLIELRKQKGVTQEDIGKIIFKKRTTISGYETEDKEPDYETLCTIANFFDVSTDYLLGVSDCKSNIEDTLYLDNTNFKKNYNALPVELKLPVTSIYDSFYNMLSDDIKNANSERLIVYEELFRELRETRSNIKKHIKLADGNMTDPVYISELLSLQNSFKSNVSAILDKLVQADFETILKDKNISGELNENAEE